MAYLINCGRVILKPDYLTEKEKWGYSDYSFGLLYYYVLYNISNKLPLFIFCPFFDVTVLQILPSTKIKYRHFLSLL